MCSMKSNGWMVYPVIAGNLGLIAWALVGNPARVLFLVLALVPFGLSIALFASNSAGDRFKGCIALASTVCALILGL